LITVRCEGLVEIQVFASLGAGYGNTPTPLDVGAHAHNVDVGQRESFVDAFDIRHTVLFCQANVEITSSFVNFSFIGNSDNVRPPVSVEPSGVILLMALHSADAKHSVIFHVWRI
jgi:hypothetical protein